MVFHTPPLADPTNMVIFPLSSTASIAEMRPLMVPEPIFLAVRPEIVPESYFTGRAGACAETAQGITAISAAIKTLARREQKDSSGIERVVLSQRMKIVTNYFAGAFSGSFFWGVLGILNLLSSMGTLTSIFFTLILARLSGSFFEPEAWENAYITPLTGL